MTQGSNGKLRDTAFLLHKGCESMYVLISVLQDIDTKGKPCVHVGALFY